MIENPNLINDKKWLIFLFLTYLRRKRNLSHRGLNLPSQLATTPGGKVRCCGRWSTLPDVATKSLATSGWLAGKCHQFPSNSCYFKHLLDECTFLKKILNMYKWPFLAVDRLRSWLSEWGTRGSTSGPAGNVGDGSFCDSSETASEYSGKPLESYRQIWKVKREFE